LFQYLKQFLSNSKLNRLPEGIDHRNRAIYGLLFDWSTSRVSSFQNGNRRWLSI